MPDEQVTNGADANDASSELAALLRLQDADLHIDQLEHRRTHPPEQAQIDELARELAKRDAQLETIDAERVELEERATSLEGEIETFRARRATIEARARSDAAGSFRDQEAMATEIGALAERMRTLEESELEVLEAVEVLEARLSALRAERAPLEQTASELRELVGVARAAVQRELETARAARARLVEDVPSALAAEYEKLRARNGGIGAARLEHGACSGCNLKIPATELDQMRHAPSGTLFHCDQCGRILVRA